MYHSYGVVVKQTESKVSHQFLKVFPLFSRHFRNGNCIVAQKIHGYKKYHAINSTVKQ